MNRHGLELFVKSVMHGNHKRRIWNLDCKFLLLKRYFYKLFLILFFSNLYLEKTFKQLLEQPCVIKTKTFIVLNVQIPVHQPPHWYTKANRTHNVWQTAADRNASRAQSEFTDDRYRGHEYPDYGSSYTSETRHEQEYRTSAQQQYKQEEYKREQQSWNSQRDTSAAQNTYSLQTAIPAPFEQGTNLQSYSGQLQKWESRRYPNNS